MFEWHKPTKGGMGNCVTLKRAILKLLVRMVLAKDVGGPRTQIFLKAQTLLSEVDAEVGTVRFTRTPDSHFRVSSRCFFVWLQVAQRAAVDTVCNS